MSEPTAHSESLEFSTEMKFRRYFTTHPDPAFRKRYPGRLEDVDFGEVVLSDAVTTLRDAINERHDANWAQIQAADGITGLHLDYLDSPERNAFAFYFDDLACIAITKGAVTRVLQIALLMSNSPNVRASLGLPTRDSSTEEDTSGVNLTGSLFTTIMQVLSSHELGHIFHGHCFESARGLPLDEDRTTEKPCFARDIEHSLRSQAMEVDADGYAAHMIVQNLFDGGMGDALHRYTRSTLPLDEFILKFLLLSAGGLFYLWSPRTFDEGSVEMCDHPFALMRMNVFMTEMNGWLEGHKPHLADWGTIPRFQALMEAVASANDDEMPRVLWERQGAYLLSKEGVRYRDRLYATRDGELRSEMKVHRWEITSALSEKIITTS